MTITECRSCKAKIAFLTMESGRSMPVDAEPTMNGTIWIGEDGIGRVVGKGDYTTISMPLYMSHFATCPNAKAYRKAKS